jgi:hypothetical protein
MHPNPEGDLFKDPEPVELPDDGEKKKRTPTPGDSTAQPPAPQPAPSVTAPSVGILITAPLFKFWGDQHDWLRALPGRLHSPPLPAPVIPPPPPILVPIPE